MASPRTLLLCLVLLVVPGVVSSGGPPAGPGAVIVYDLAADEEIHRVEIAKPTHVAALDGDRLAWGEKSRRSTVVYYDDLADDAEPRIVFRAKNWLRGLTFAEDQLVVYQNEDRGSGGEWPDRYILIDRVDIESGASVRLLDMKDDTPRLFRTGRHLAWVQQDGIDFHSGPTSLYLFDVLTEEWLFEGVPTEALGMASRIALIALTDEWLFLRNVSTPQDKYLFSFDDRRLEQNDLPAVRSDGDLGHLGDRTFYTQDLLVISEWQYGQEPDESLLHLSLLDLHGRSEPRNHTLASWAIHGGVLHVEGDRALLYAAHGTFWGRLVPGPSALLIAAVLLGVFCASPVRPPRLAG